MAIKVNTVNQALLRLECDRADIGNFNTTQNIVQAWGLRAFQIDTNQVFRDVFDKYDGALAFAGGAYYKTVNDKKEWTNMIVWGCPNMGLSNDNRYLTILAKNIGNGDITEAEKLVFYFWILNK